VAAPQTSTHHNRALAAGGVEVVEVRAIALEFQLFAAPRARREPPAQSSAHPGANQIKRTNQVRNKSSEQTRCEPNQAPCWTMGNPISGTRHWTSEPAQRRCRNEVQGERRKHRNPDQPQGRCECMHGRNLNQNGGKQCSICQSKACEQLSTSNENREPRVEMETSGGEPNHSR
jgi:hypothetical protein